MKSFFSAITLMLCSSVPAVADISSAKQDLTIIESRLDNPTTLYCGCRLVFKSSDRYVPELDSCGYSVREDKVRAHRVEAEHIVPIPPTRYRAIGPMLVRVLRMTLNQRPAIDSLIFRLIILRLAFSYF